MGCEHRILAEGCASWKFTGLLKGIDRHAREARHLGGRSLPHRLAHVGPVWPFRAPTTAGPTKPEKLTIVATSAMPPAAAWPTRNAVGIDQNGPWHLEQAVTEEEHSRPQAECGGAELEVRVHLQRGKTNVYAVKPRSDVEHKQERNQASRNSPNGRNANHLVLSHAAPRRARRMTGY